MQIGYLKITTVYNLKKSINSQKTKFSMKTPEEVVKIFRKSRDEQRKNGFAPIFRELTECPYIKIHKFIFAQTIERGLNSIYMKNGNFWQIIQYKKYILLGYGSNPTVKVFDFDSDKDIDYEHINGMDCIHIKYPKKNNYLNAHSIFGEIYKSLKKNGL